jgi:hypothetical protein
MYFFLRLGLNLSNLWKNVPFFFFFFCFHGLTYSQKMWILYKFLRTPWTDLPAQNNSRKHPCPKRGSNPRNQCSRGSRTYDGVSKSFRNESITKHTLTFGITLWEATQRVMAAKLSTLTHKIAIQLHLVAESCAICSSRSRWPVRKLLDTPSNTTRP